MGKLIQVELTKIRRYPATWVVALITFAQALFWVFTHKYDANLARYPQVEYVLFTYSTARWFCISSVFLTGYIIAGDFSMRTVLNVLSTGIDKGKYYVSRLAAVLLFTWALFAGSNLFYIVVRILVTGNISTALPLKELLVLLSVMSLQVLSYAAIAHMISICCQKQGLSILLGEVYLFLALIIRMSAMGEEYYTNAGYRLHGPIAYEPLYVLEKAADFLTGDTLFCFGFLKYALSAALIITVASLVGYARLTHSDVQ